jgi:hypothetical protein
LIERMMNSTSGSKRRKKDLKVSRGGLALGYEVLEIRDDGDEGELYFIPGLQVEERKGASCTESAPPLSVYHPPSSHSSFTKLVPTALPPKALSVRASIWDVLMIGNGYYDLTRLDETCFYGMSAAVSDSAKADR